MKIKFPSIAKPPSKGDSVNTLSLSGNNTKLRLNLN